MDRFTCVISASLEMRGRGKLNKHVPFCTLVYCSAGQGDIVLRTDFQPRMNSSKARMRIGIDLGHERNCETPLVV